MLAPRITESHSKPLAPSHSWGPAPTTSTLAVPYDMPSTLDISSIGPSRASDEGSFDAGDSTGATTARSPTLAADATKGEHGDVTEHTAC
jgi:hypothetical protein